MLTFDDKHLSLNLSHPGLDPGSITDDKPLSRIANRALRTAILRLWLTGNRHTRHS